MLTPLNARHIYSPKVNEFTARCTMLIISVNHPPDPTLLGVCLIICIATLVLQSARNNPPEP